MTTATVNVKYINKSKSGTMWAIKDDHGMSYWRTVPIPEELLGQSCDITFQEGKDGFRKLTSINAAASIHPPQSNGHAKASKNDEDIAVLALAKSFIEAGKIQDVAHVSRALKVLRDEWREYKSEPPKTDDFNDDPIPDWGLSRMITCDVIKCSYRQSKDGFVVAFVIHPQDMPVDLASADIGSQWRMMLVPLDENGNATTEEEAPAEDTGTNATVTEKALRQRGPHLQESVAPVSRLTRQAAIACRDPVFQAFLTEQFGMGLFNMGTMEERAVETVYKTCDVASRREFTPSTPAGDRWETLYSRFIAWRDAPEQIP